MNSRVKIFYGAGGNAAMNFDKWLRGGDIPVCFADADVSKHHTMFKGVEVLPLLEAVSKHSDYEIYCTQSAENLQEVYDFLLCCGIPRDRINAFEKPAICYKKNKNIYSRMHMIYQALQDDLSRKLFMGRLEYSLSHKLTSVYRAMICSENMDFQRGKTTYAEQRYGLNGLWDLLYQNYPEQKNRIILMGFDDDWNEYNWIVERFLEAMGEMDISIEGCFMPYRKDVPICYMGIPCLSEAEFMNRVNDNARIIVGFPGWCLEMKEVVEQYKSFKNILYPIADTLNPSYIEPEIFNLDSREIFVDIGVLNLQNSIDFAEWANNSAGGFEKIYAFEPDSKAYTYSMKRLAEIDGEDRKKIELVNLGLGSEEKMVEFPVEYKGSGAKKNNEMISLKVVSLDAYLNGKPVTFVKMDVEGAEMDVLLGMQKTIVKYKPKLAVCIYHKHEDLFDISSFLLDLVPEYKFHIRHYNSNETECVLFCQV